MAERVQRALVVGAGIGGLMSALALQDRGVAVLMVERDPAPPDGIAPAESMAWLRKGVPQSLHPHFFMGRLRGLLEERYPDLVDRLLAAGVGENALADYIHPGLAHRYRPRADDDRLRSLNSRRTTFEMIVRDHVAGLPGIELRAGCAARGLLMETLADGPARVRGLEVNTATGSERLEADVVVDASGRFSRLTRQLEEAGVAMRVDQRDSGIWYFTRHYRLRPGCSYPQTAGLPGSRFRDFIVGALPADNGAFTITFQIYREDRAIAAALRQPEHFDAMCAATGSLAPWVDPAIAEPTSDVYGFGQMDSFWRQTVVDGKPQVLGYFCVGDNCVRSNPKYGRGCTWATLAAHHLADVLSDPRLDEGARIQRYEERLEAELRSDWLTMRRLDRATEAAFEVASGRRSASLGERAAQSFEALVDAALVTEPVVFREVWSGYHGITGMADWLKVPRVWPRLLRAAYEMFRDRRRLRERTRRPSREALAGAGEAAAAPTAG